MRVQEIHTMYTHGNITYMQHIYFVWEKILAKPTALAQDCCTQFTCIFTKRVTVAHPL